MSAKLHAYLNIPSHRKVMIGLLVILALAVIAGFHWIETEPVIAPPGLRVLSWLWRVFVCWCPV